MHALSRFTSKANAKATSKAKAVCRIALLAAALSACQEQPFEEPPIHPNLNMDFQSNFKAQEENEMFADKRAMRPLLPGTVARGHLNEDDALHRGKVGDAWVTTNPVPVNRQMLERGQERFDIYCAICHGRTGTGEGVVVQRGMLKPPSFHDERIVAMPDGQIYDAILNGVRGNMPSYAYAIPVEDRWAIIAYTRALQLSRRASLDDVPADIANEKGWIKR